MLKEGEKRGNRGRDLIKRECEGRDRQLFTFPFISTKALLSGKISTEFFLFVNII